MRDMIYPSPAIPVGEPAPGMEEVVITSGDGSTLVGWYKPLAGVTLKRPAILFLHGNGENLETLRATATLAHLDALEAPYLVVDYPGYGRSSGAPSEDALEKAAEAALEWLIEQHPDRPLLVCGWSLGAAVAFYLASKHESLDGLVAISAWTSLREVAAIHFPNWLVGLALRESYDSIAVAGQIQQSSLLIHGARDQIIPVEQGRRLAAAVPDADWLEQDSAGHNDLLSYPDVWHAIRLFVDRIEKSRTV